MKETKETKEYRKSEYVHELFTNPVHLGDKLLKDLDDYGISYQIHRSEFQVLENRMVHCLHIKIERDWERKLNERKFENKEKEEKKRQLRLLS